MKPKVEEVHIAVFGESGSGKTVLLSSYYGATQEPTFAHKNLYHVLADNMAQGHTLRQNYLRMREQARTPSTTTFASNTYSFTLKPDATAAVKGQPFDALRLVWHDYPGQWFAEDPGSAEVADRRVRTFTDLLSADVAIVLVDGQKLLDNAGEEERYLKSMIWSIKGGLEALKDGILVNGKKLSTFPRIWVLALSKADLHPGLNASRFEDLIIEKAAGDLNELQTTLRGFVSEPDALSLGEDYMLLSSARFEPGRIRVDERVGVDLIAPVACTLPLERAAQWVAGGVNPKKLEPLIKHMDGIAAALGGAGRCGSGQEGGRQGAEAGEAGRRAGRPGRPGLRPCAQGRQGQAAGGPRCRACKARPHHRDRDAVQDGPGEGRAGPAHGEAPVNLIWATCGRNWGFRFLLDGGLGDPLALYESAFAGTDGEESVCRAVQGGATALRFPDPQGREDAAGRTIPHDFVVLGQDPRMGSVEDGVRAVWPVVSGVYAQVWEAAAPPTVQAIRSAIEDSTPDP